MNSKKIESLQKIYKRNRYYHGTNRVGQESMIENGMDVNAKKSGATDTLGFDPKSEFSTTAAKYNYLTKNKKIGMSYANTSSLGKNEEAGEPKLVRVYKTNKRFPDLTDDEDSPSDHEAFRTTKKISKSNIRRHKRKSNGPYKYPTKVLKQFQEDLFKEIGEHVRKREIKELIKDVESDSDDDDFKSVGGMGLGQN